MDWVYAPTTSLADGVAVLEFVRDRLGQNPDFGDRIDEHTRAEIAPGSTVEVVWTFNPHQRYVEIVTPVVVPSADSDK
jgi:hypothetical protein